MKAGRTVLTLMACLVLPVAFDGVRARAGEAPWRNWQTTLDSAHPLVGKILAVRTGKYITPSALADALSKNRYILLGEIHDNPDHHRLQGWLISQLVARGRRPAVVMEQIRQDKAAALSTYLKRDDATAEGLGPAVGWQKSGWPPWKIYQPIAEAAFGGRLRIKAGDPARKTLRSVGRKGFSVLPDGRQKSLKLEQSLEPPLLADLKTELFESHCKLMPKTALSPLVNVQRYRDAVLAESLVNAGEADGTVLITGNGHARSDRGVPWYLKRHGPDASIATVQIVEAEQDGDKLSHLTLNDPDGKIAADYVWITPRAQREDQCEALRKRFGKKKDR